MAQQKIEIQSENDIYLALSAARQDMAKLSFSELDKQKVLVSVSELTRNVLIHGYGKGIFECRVANGGIHLAVTDQGPGIPHVQEILEGKKILSSKGLGLGLSGVKRLMDEFYIETGEGGTRVVVIKWKNAAT